MFIVLISEYKGTLLQIIWKNAKGYKKKNVILSPIILSLRDNHCEDFDLFLFNLSPAPHPSRSLRQLQKGNY